MKTLQELKDYKGDYYYIYQVDDIKKDIACKIYSDNKNTYYYKDYQFKIKRVKNDINGNPLYKIILSKDFINITSQLKGLATRCYISKGYCILQSYNIGNDLNYLFIKLENKLNNK